MFNRLNRYNIVLLNNSQIYFFFSKEEVEAFFLNNS